VKLGRILIIARKEFRDVTRDRRTLIFMLLLPSVIIPLILTLVTSVMRTQSQAKEERNLTVAIDKGEEQLLRTLGARWMHDNGTAVTALALHLGLPDVHGIPDLAQLADIAKRMQRSPDQPPTDSEQVQTMVAWNTLDPDQQQLLQDAGAVGSVLGRTDWVDIQKDVIDVTPAGPLPQGVHLPDHLPGPLADPRVSLAVTGRAKAVHAAVVLQAADIDEFLNADPSHATALPITVLYDASQSLSREAYDRFVAFVAALARSEVRLRLQAASLSRDFVTPFDLKEANIASQSREVQALIGSLLPYLAILFCFFGAFYPSLDLTAGEKERFTLETLLLAPVSRVEIAAGKFLVVFATSVTAAVLTIASLAYTITHGVLPEGAVQAFHLHFEIPAVLLTASLLVPVAALFASLLLTIALFARSFKEAQSYAMPLQLLVILPAMTALMPDLQTDLKWAWVPLMNVSLLMRELLKGNYLWDFYFITLGSMLLLSGFTLWIAGQVFRRETVLLRT
jgi:sodium transport system permease protein